ncbi:pectate lyase superfamily protein-domain-containing protein [Microdochium trichocladiopsis]|uniref:Pectate lyase superfamily protein-domain-containing protein n=1 Tax=Microdochium trichocladiopsis TaxID=1682393 RepID=A0A9P8Y1N0_9PEZI|nr:pectate lyase superfamily protein-domain-containing protein [Microdochium trichocladiopsis]KAH7027557.1 pectate lyase superfamily protein-domain-containing protein [Microdochium trichocladiopsis]
MVKLGAWLPFAALSGLLYTPTVLGQYSQDYDVDTTTGDLLYTPNSGDLPILVIRTEDVTVHLEYNCYYMREICANADNFYTLSRGQTLHPVNGLSNTEFGYDMNVARKEDRRDQSCPDSWKRHHSCPERGQPVQQKPMRHDGMWWTIDTDPNVNGRPNLHIRDMHISTISGPIIHLSNMSYTCDEFPPATWVEGGSGSSLNSAAETRCAAMGCGRARAEQNWQASAHSQLRGKLHKHAKDLSGYDGGESIVLFQFRYSNNGPDGAAARIIEEFEDGHLVETFTEVWRRQTHGTLLPHLRHTRPPFSREERRALIEAGEALETIIHADMSRVSVWVLASITPKARDLLPYDTVAPYSWAAFGLNSTTQNATYMLPRTLPFVSIPRARSIADGYATPLLKRATAHDLQAARETVKKAQAAANKLNKARVANPLRNKYSLKPGTVVGGSSNTTVKSKRLTARDSTAETAPPLLEITDEIAAAAALVAEAEASVGSFNSTSKRRIAARSGTFWMEHLARKGTVPWGDDPNHVVFRNVLDYGAIGDGVTDDTKAINKAMGTNSTACGKGCNGSTTKNAIVYFPPGTYLVSSTIAMPYGTQVIGDANDRPIIMAASSFVGLGVLSNDEYTGSEGKGTDGGDPEYYVNTANFYRQIRNIVIDIRKIASGQTVTCLHYQVAQATSTQNLELIAAAGSEQIGMFAENGSGGGISDITFTGGGIGIKGGEQQFTAQRLTFNGCTVGVQVIWDWGWVWRSITMNNVGTGFKLVGDGGVGNIGSASIMDSSFTNVQTMVTLNPITATPGQGSTGLVLENLALSGVGAAVVDTTGATLLPASSTIDQWVIGPVYEGSASARSFSNGGKVGEFRRHQSLLDSQGNYYERPRPQYEDQDVSMFVHTKDLGCMGDGSTDDTTAFQTAVFSSVGKILFIDAGSYILTSTITIPPGVKIIGETWSQLVASGAYFSDASNPKVLIRVGRPGDIGTVEIQDLIFTTRGATAGAILIEWNLEAESPGAAGLWDCHVRIGGATGTELTPAECPPVTSGVNPQCSAASLMMHLTPSASGYFENMWLWGADHMIDDPDLKSESNPMVQTSIYIARGFLIESVKPTWLYGTASEHAVFYQYNFYGAANIYAGMLQTESPYYQPNPTPPAPFTNVVGQFPSDPNYSCTAGDEFSGCDQSWSVIITGSKNIFVASAGIYSWFTTYTQSCIDSHSGQKVLMLLKDNFSNIRIQNLITIGAKYMAVMEGKGIPAIDNLNVEGHPRWSQISVLDVGRDGQTQFDEKVWIDRKIWDMDQPAFTCSAPCYVQIPPYKGATNVVDYPLVTVSQGAWTSTITKPPLTITEWVFEPMSITMDGAPGVHKRAQTTQVTPVLATTPIWPGFVYYGGEDGLLTTTAATVPFPTPSTATINGRGGGDSNGVDLVALAGIIQVIYGSLNSPTTNLCNYTDWDDPSCPPKPYTNTAGSDGYGWAWGGSLTTVNEDAEIEPLCLLDIDPELPGRDITATAPAPPTPTPTNILGDPHDNAVRCFNSGEQTEQERMFYAADAFCGSLEDDDMGPGYYKLSTSKFNFNGGVGWVSIDVSLEVKDGCRFDYDRKLCNMYLAKTALSCNCDHTYGKQGGVLENHCYTWMVDPQWNL